MRHQSVFELISNIASMTGGLIQPAVPNLYLFKLALHELRIFSEVSNSFPELCCRICARLHSHCTHPQRSMACACAEVSKLLLTRYFTDAFGIMGMCCDNELFPAPLLRTAPTLALDVWHSTARHSESMTPGTWVAGRLADSLAFPDIPTTMLASRHSCHGDISN